MKKFYGHVESGTYFLVIKGPGDIGDAGTYNLSVSEDPLSGNDEIPPTLQVVSPHPAQIVSGTLDISSLAHDNFVLSQVSYFLNNILFDEIKSSPFRTSLNTLQKPNGLYQLKAVAEDLSGNTTEEEVTFTIHNFQTQASVNKEKNVFNPLQENLRISYALTKPSPVNIFIYNRKGLVRSLPVGTKPAGQHVDLWDGRNDQDETVASGVYYCDVVHQNGKETKTLVVIK